MIIYQTISIIYDNILAHIDDIRLYQTISIIYVYVLGYIDCAALLLQYGALPDSLDNYGNNPSHWARTKGFESMISILRLPNPVCVSADAYLKLLIARNKNFKLPKIKTKKKKKKKGKK